ncbi:DNA alkylation repair protein [Carnobacterium gallinarum]|uniref:DNA alkylation repair protein n=1 Tax=Carnobacterium gallinarum TaxID=2749 RepID=UPI000554537C|nr:DNA alkylation repair protein [Carnobacterium gallinarum]
MVTALKDMYHQEFLIEFAGKVKGAAPYFNIDEFVVAVMDDSWEELKLKERMRRISTMLEANLEGDYSRKLAVLFAIADQCHGFPYLFFPDFVEVYGLAEKDWDLSMEALACFTQKSSSEFAIRPFILLNPIKGMTQMKQWALSDNVDLRRLASEGCRPRLPWGQALGIFKEDPEPVLAIVELLKSDSELYVQKSVANNLNDIAKDHPDRIVEIVKKWQGQTTETDWILRKGCRTLIKQAVPEIMFLFGYPAILGRIELAELTVTPKEITIGDKGKLSYHFQVNTGEELKLRMEYGIYFVKANGQAKRKLFFLSEQKVAGNTLIKGQRSHDWKNLTTRKHYVGEHRIVLVVNGVEIAETVLSLK